MPQDIDLSYLGLTPDERTPDDVVADALTYAQQRLPEWIPRNGAVETVILEAAALASAEIQTALNNLPGRVAEGILNLYGVPRSDGTVASGEVTITFDTAVTTTVPEGTSFLLPDYELDLVSTVAVAVTSSTTAVIPVETSTETGEINGVSSASVDLLDAVPNAQSVAITTAFSGGSDAESDDEYLDRASTVLARVTSSLVVPTHFTAYALQDVRIGRATTVDLYEPGGTEGSDTGHVTTFMYGRGAAVPTATLGELRETMSELSAAMMQVHTAAATLTTVDVTATVAILAGYTEADVLADCEAAVEAWLSPDTWEWDDDVRPNDIIDLLSDVTGVDYVDAVTEPSEVTAITTPGGLTTPGTISVTAV